jgi:hypothetical protein
MKQQLRYTLEKQNLTPPSFNICFFHKKKGSLQFAHVCKKSTPPLKNVSVSVVFESMRSACLLSLRSVPKATS